MSEQKATGELFTKIESRPVAASYQMWLEGHDLRQILPKNTFYRHRRALLVHEIDISIPHVREEQRPSNVVPLKSVLQMRVAEIPAWAYGTAFLFEPRKFA
ncbi:Phage X family protein [compost metagenome]